MESVTPITITKEKQLETTFERTKSAAWSGLRSLLQVLETSSGVFPPLKSAVGGLNRFIEVFETASQGRREFEELIITLLGLLEDTGAHVSNKGDPGMTNSVKNLWTGLDEELKIVESKYNRGGILRIEEALDDSEEIAKCHRRIHGHLERLALNANLSMWETVNESATETRLKGLSPALSAVYNSAESEKVKRRECTPGTREKALDKLLGWARNKSPEAEDVYWMNGMAGTGKTTIACSLCAELEKSSELGASFFCSRLLPECRDVNLIIPCVAYQLARFSIPFYHALSDILKGDPDVHTRVLKTQFEDLLVKPLNQVKNTLPTGFVIVIDALDECDSEDSVGQILDLLLSHTATPDLPVRFLLSSRPESKIYQKMMARVGHSFQARLVLHDLDVQAVKLDIKTYLEAELAFVDLTSAQLTKLVDLSGVLFIFASTTARYIVEGQELMEVEERLAMVLGLSSECTSDKDRAIDQLYTSILQAVSQKKNVSKQTWTRLKIILDTVVCAQEPLTADGLAGLLGEKSGKHVEALLRQLSSILDISESTGLVTSLHASFPDYMLEAERSLSFHCNPIVTHTRLSYACLETMKTKQPQFNICALESSYLADDRDAELNKRADRAASLHLFYACRYWITASLPPSRQRVHRGDEVGLFIWSLNALRLISHMPPAQHTRFQTRRLVSQTRNPEHVSDRATSRSTSRSYPAPYEYPIDYFPHIEPTPNLSLQMSTKAKSRPRAMRGRRGKSVPSTSSRNQQLVTPQSAARPRGDDSSDDSWTTDTEEETPRVPPSTYNLRPVENPSTPPRDPPSHPEDSPTLNRNPKPGRSPDETPRASRAPHLVPPAFAAAFDRSSSPFHFIPLPPSVPVTPRPPALVSPKSQPLPALVTPVEMQPGSALVSQAVPESAVPVTLTSPSPRAATLVQPPVATPSPAKTPRPAPHSPQSSPTSQLLSPFAPRMSNTTAQAENMLKAAWAQLGKLEDFNDNGSPMREAEWRYKFNAATRHVSDEERAQLWLDKLVYEGEAYEWADILRNSSDPEDVAALKDWSKLEPLIEKRWPTPKRDKVARDEHLWDRWVKSKLVPEDMVEEWQDSKCQIKPHATWANQHQARGLAVGSVPKDLVRQTLNVALPAWVVAELPNSRHKYVDNFAELCEDIANLSSTVLRDAYKLHTRMEMVYQLTENLSLSTARPPPAPNVRRPALAPAPVVKDSTRNIRTTQVAFVEPLPSALKVPARRDAPPHLANLPPSPEARRLRDPAPSLFAPDTPEEWAKYQALASAYRSTHGSARPTLDRPFPLSPGTLHQTRDTCYKCGKATHWVTECRDKDKWVEEEERQMREAIGKDLRKHRHQARTPAPYSRQVVDVNQLEAETDGYTEAEESENEWGCSCDLFVPPSRQIVPPVPSQSPTHEYVDLFEIDDYIHKKENPFQKWAKILPSAGADHAIDARVTVDGGAMLCVMDQTYWSAAESVLGPLAKSRIICRMANGACTHSIGRGQITLELAGQQYLIEYEVLDARGNYDILLGKSWLRLARAAQRFFDDTLVLAGSTGLVEIHNDFPLPELPPAPNLPIPAVGPKLEPIPEPVPEPIPEPKPIPEPEPKLETAHEQEPEPNTAAESPGEPVPRRSRRIQGLPPKAVAQEGGLVWVEGQMLEALESDLRQQVEKPAVEVQAVTLKRLTGIDETPESDAEYVERMWRLICSEETPEDAQQTSGRHCIDEILDRAQRATERARGPADLQALELPASQFRTERHLSAQKSVIIPPVPVSARTADPFATDRVAAILNKVKIGDNLTPEQKKQVADLVREYADIFALSLSEVLPTDFTEMRLNIPEGTTFPKRAGQRKFTEPQRKWLYSVLDDMEKAQIIAKVSQDHVAAVSPTNVVPKPGGAELPSLTTLRRMANEQCEKYGLPILWPDVDAEGPESKPEPLETKYRLVHNFSAVNRVTELRPFPMGDLAAMHRKVAGHRWVSVMDFMAGFNAIPMAPESVPYTGFHVDGRGYYVYLRMPFGLTGAPTTFCEMVAAAFHDLIGNEVEVWMDDVATACDDFDVGMANMKTIFAKCRTHGLSLSPAKTVLFMSEARFAGARCSVEGVRADPTKIRAILEWPEPKSALEIMSFLGCVGSFRSKIKDYAVIAQPLSDLMRNVRPPQIDTPASKHEYKRALRDQNINFNDEQKKAFVALKTILTSDTVTRAPVYDGRPFTVTTDGSKYGFGAVLSQEWEVVDQDGSLRKVMYPVAFASKRTSKTEEHYIPFLLEFAALKFALDEFDNMIYGQPIILETDCKALADLLGNNKLNSTHERWRESIIARQIIAVRHRPGTQNRVCDSLSRMYESRPDYNTAPGINETVDPGWEHAKGIVNDVSLLINDEQVAKLLDRFAGDAYFADILVHLLFDTGATDNVSNPEELRARKRRAHRAENFWVNDGKLWFLNESSLNRNSKVECIPASETKQLALEIHSAGGHFGRDLTILAVQQRYFWPHIRRDVTEAVTTCPRCKNFGPPLLSAQLKPITRARPFDLLVGDYLSMPTGFNGFKTILVLVDVYSRFVFAFPLRGPGTGKTTVEALSKVSEMLLTPKSFLADGGSHFDCNEVREWAAKRNVQLIKTPPYAPWTNGLAEGHVKLIIERLKRLCTATVGQSEGEDNNPSATPASWPKHLSDAVAQLNDRPLPSLHYSPRELLTGQLSAERRAELSRALRETTSQEVEVNMALTYSVRQDAYALALEHANKRKKIFDKKVREIEYKPGDLVQRYDARWDETHSTERKLVPRWSGPLRVVARAANSYSLEDLQGRPFTAAAHARLLRPFLPSPGSTLEAYLEGLRQARKSDPDAVLPLAADRLPPLPSTPRPETRFPVARADPTQPDYQKPLTTS